MQSSNFHMPETFDIETALTASQMVLTEPLISYGFFFLTLYNYINWTTLFSSVNKQTSWSSYLYLMVRIF